MIFDDRRTLRTVNEAPNDFTIKIFLYLAMKHHEEGIRGFQIDNMTSANADFAKAKELGYNG